MRERERERKGNPIHNVLSLSQQMQKNYAKRRIGAVLIICDLVYIKVLSGAQKPSPILFEILIKEIRWWGSNYETMKHRVFDK